MTEHIKDIVHILIIRLHKLLTNTVIGIICIKTEERISSKEDPSPTMDLIS